MGESEPYLFCDERHERMKQFKCLTKDINKNCSGSFSLFTALLKSDFGYFNIPVAEDIPYEVIQLLNGNAEFKLVKVVRDLLNESVEE